MSRALPDVEIAVLGDLHGDFDLALDAALLERYPLRTCTGDFTPNHGHDRYDIALRIARELATARVQCVLGNHDGPTCFTGRAFPRSYRRLETALGDCHVGGRRVEFPELGLTLVGARPLSCGGPKLRFAPPDQADWTLAAWADAIAAAVAAAEQPRVVVLAHVGPTGLGAEPSDVYGCDFRAAGGDWGDPDLREALDRSLSAGVSIPAVIAGHMHHALQGGGERVRSVREGQTLHVNAAVVPRVSERGRALVVVSLSGQTATARIEWHAPDGVAIEPLA